MLDTRDALVAQLVAARAIGAKIPATGDTAIAIGVSLAADKLGVCVRAPTDAGADTNGSDAALDAADGGLDG